MSSTQHIRNAVLIASLFAFVAESYIVPGSLEASGHRLSKVLGAASSGIIVLPVDSS